MAVESETTTRVLIAVDPGVTKGSAWALFIDGSLADAGVSRASGRGVAAAVAQPLPIRRPTHAVVECPVWYPGQRRERRSDVRDLCLVAGSWIGRLAQLGAEVRDVEPSAWKGSLPKPTSRAGRYVVETRARAALSEDEIDAARAALSASPAGMAWDVWDAVCLGLWALGRVRMR